MINEQLSLIKKYVDNNRDNIIAVWREVVQHESCVREVDNVRKMALEFKELFEKEGLDCYLIEAKPNGPTLVGTLNANKGKPIILSGHLDTVFAQGSFGEDLFEIKDGKAYGPGVLDMKGGLVIALFVIKALNSINAEIPLKIIISGDEEIGHEGSNGGQVFQEEAKGGHFAFNMETGRIDNSLCIGRKGHLGCEIVVTGQAAHAGNDFEAGRNAIEEMAYKIIEIQKLSDLHAGTTVNTGVITGGSVANAIPDKCWVELDIRYTKTSEYDRIKAELNKIAQECTITQTTTTLEFSGDFPSFETTANVKAFYNFICETAQEFAFRVPNHIFLGGCSDASFVNLAKTPVVCAFGVLGEWNHTLNEYALVDSMYERINLISAIILNKDNFNDEMGLE